LLAFSGLLAAAGRVTPFVRRAAVSVVALELVALTWLASPPHEPFTGQYPGTLQALSLRDGQPNRVLGIGRVVVPDISILGRIPELRMRDDMYPPQYTPIWDRISGWEQIDSGAPLRSWHLAENRPPADWDLLRLFGVGAIVSGAPVPGNGEQVVLPNALLGNPSPDGAPEAPPPRVQRVTVGAQEREAVVVEAPSTLWERLNVPRGDSPWAQVRYAAMVADRGAIGTRLRFQVVVRGNGGEAVLDDQKLPSFSAQDGSWHDREVNLSAYRGKSIELGLRLLPDDDEQRPRARGAWSAIWVGSGAIPDLVRGPTFVVREVPDALPRAFLAVGAQQLADPEAFLDRPPAAVLRGDIVMLEASSDEVHPPSNASCARSAVQWDARTMNGMTLRFETACPAYLVVNDLWYPGWHAWLDNGRELPVLRANSAVRAVFVPPGRHLLVMQFWPVVGLVSLAVSLAGWVLVLVLVLLGGQGRGQRT
jgi:hypothetical protein